MSRRKIAMSFVMLIITLLILIGFLVKPAILPQAWPWTTVSSSNNNGQLEELYSAAQLDLCRQVNFYQSSNGFWQRANRNCEQLMYKYKYLPKKLQYNCQKPSLPAMCQKIDPKNQFSSYECTFEAEFVMDPSPRNPGIRFQAKMITCVNSIRNGKPSPGASIPVAHPPPGWNPAQPPQNWSPGPRPHGSVAVPYTFAGLFPGAQHPFNSFPGSHYPPSLNPTSNFPAGPLLVSNHPSSSIPGLNYPPNQILGASYPPGPTTGSSYPPTPIPGLNYPPNLISGSYNALIPSWVPTWLRGRFRRSKKSQKN